MIQKHYKINLDEGWEFIVAANDPKEAIENLNVYLDTLILDDGYTMQVVKVKVELEASRFKIDEYIGIVVSKN